MKENEHTGDSQQEESEDSQQEESDDSQQEESDDSQDEESGDSQDEESGDSQDEESGGSQDEESGGSQDEESADSEPPKSREEREREKVLSKFQERQGKQLFIRFPNKLPEEEAEFQMQVKALSPLITKSHKPRQKHARFCLVDFATNSDRDQVLKALQKAAKVETAPNKRIHVCLPKTENPEFVRELAERKVKSIENKKAKTRLRKASKAAVGKSHYTPSIVVLNLPKTCVVAEVRKLFPNAVDIQLKPRRGKLNDCSLAAITLPSTQDARTAVKRQISLSGTQLKIRFNAQDGKGKKAASSPKVKTTKRKSTSAEQGAPASPVKKVKVGKAKIATTTKALK